MERERSGHAQVARPNRHPLRAPRRPHRRRPSRQVRSRLSPRRSLTALARQSRREHSNRRHDIAPLARFRFRFSLHRRGSGSGKSIKMGLAAPRARRHPSVRSPPSFRPDLRARHAGARSGGQGWPVFGPPRQRREASLTAASTTAASTASGLRSPYPTNKPSKGLRERPSKNELTLSTRGGRDPAVAGRLRLGGGTQPSASLVKRGTKRFKSDT